MSVPNSGNPLQELAIRHGTDKFGLHDYTNCYWRLLAGLRDEPVRLLEIGIGGYTHLHEGGASLAMWRDFFRHGTVVGIDAYEKDLDLGPRVTCVQGHQGDAAVLDAISSDHGPFDIVIDDGSHVNADVIVTFDHLFPMLADGGLYIIEDTQTSYFPDFGGAIEQGEQLILGYFARLFRDVDYAELRSRHPNAPFNKHAMQVVAIHRFHNVIAIEKGSNSFPSNFDFAKMDDEMFDDILSAMTCTRGSSNHARLGALFDFLFAGRRYARAESVLQSIRRLPPLPRSYFERALLLAKAVKDSGRIHAVEEAQRVFHAQYKEPSA